MTDIRHVRAIFISDVHLGTKGAQAEKLLTFLKNYEAEYLYLVGDIADGWRLKATWYWHQSHNDIVQKILRKVRKGTKVIYLPGNHDEFLRQFLGLNFGGIDILDETIHTTKQGKKILILHGDKFDVVIRNAKWLALLGDWAYDLALYLNRHIAKLRQWMGYPYWSFSAWSKQKVKRAVNFVADFERLIKEEAQKNNVDAVLCGHIHIPDMKMIDETLYLNCGDWVESNTAIIEDNEGELSLVYFDKLNLS
jgi:UDP-2,3-diacylglucosamine pyrophosphatase LpxH